MSKAMKVVEYLLDLSGIDRRRMTVEWVSAAEGKRFAEVVTQFTNQTLDLGPFDPEAHALELAAVEQALDSPRLRWLMGMEIQLTDKENVYHEKLDTAHYGHLLKEVSREQYEKALISEILKEGPGSVREIAFKSGLPVYSVSMRLGEMERHHRVELHQYRGTVPLFSNQASSEAI